MGHGVKAPLSAPTKQGIEACDRMPFSLQDRRGNRGHHGVLGTFQPPLLLSLLQVSEQGVLLLQPASGLHFPAVEHLREAVHQRALAGTGRCARAGSLPLGFGRS